MRGVEVGPKSTVRKLRREILMWKKPNAEGDGKVGM